MNDKVAKERGELPIMLEGLDNEEYHSGPGVSSTDIRNLLVSGEQYQWSKDPENKEDATEAMIVGDAFHLLVLEPEKFAGMYNPGEQPFKTTTKGGNKNWSIIHRMRDAVMRSPEALAALGFSAGQDAPVFYEASIYWRDAHGSLNKARPDTLVPEHAFFGDLKTITDIDHIQREFFARGYHIQAAHYANGLRELYLKDFTEVFVFVEKNHTGPCRVAVRFVSEQDKMAGAAMAAEGLRRYHEYNTSGIWPAWSDPEPPELTSPVWYRMQNQDFYG